MKLLTLSFGLMASAFVGLGSTPAAAQEVIEMPASGSCPAGYSRTNVNSQSARNAVRNYKCQRDGATYQAASTGSFTKANPLDRCPIGWFTDPENGRVCKTEAANPPAIRLQGAAPCRTGEVVDWGLYCVSNYANLEAGERAKGISDFNAIFLQSYYITGSQQSPRQANLAQGTEYTPAYFTIYGNVTPDGAPIGGGGAPPPSAAAAATPASTRPSRTSGTLNPQLRTNASFLCAEGWVSGLAGTRNGNANMCYPNPGATPAFPRQNEAETCPAGYVLSSTWCAQGSNGMPGQTAAQATPTNCPAPAGNAQAGAQLGAQLGGFLGRRGNSQAGAALGGLLGAAAGAQANKPAGCP